MIEKLINEFPYRFNRVLASELGVSPRSLIRKARELRIEKEPGFLEKNRDVITRMAVEAHPPQQTKGKKGWSVPNSEHTRFKKGSISVMAIDPDVVEKVRRSRNKTIRREKLRIKYGLPQKTRLKLIDIYK